MLRTLFFLLRGTNPAFNPGPGAELCLLESSTQSNPPLRNHPDTGGVCLTQGNVPKKILHPLRASKIRNLGSLGWFEGAQLGNSGFNGKSSFS